MDLNYEFAPYGQEFRPEAGIIVLDVGLKTVPGVIDHHHPEAEPECTASLIVKYPELVLNHFGDKTETLTIITHRLPDFDAVSAIFLTLKLLETRTLDPAMIKLASYARMADSATIPKNIDLNSTPYALLRALFTNLRKSQEEASLERVAEGLRMMRLLYEQATLGRDIVANRLIFQGIDRYQKASQMVEDDYFSYLEDLEKAEKLQLNLPLSYGHGYRLVDGLAVQNPKSFLLKEWARRDIFKSPLGQGFSFLLTNLSNKRYIMGVDPEAGVNLKGLGALLNQKEKQKRDLINSNSPSSASWYEGNCPFFNYRIIDSPQDGSALSYQEILDLVIQFSQQIRLSPGA
ncbi:MAG: hypothetical protein PHQ48_08710 [Acidobacteriota bacterium]|nr:hypothetical protein [Acidobacteriota bacterium]